MRILQLVDHGGRRSIETKAWLAHDDILRCWRMVPRLSWRPAGQRAGNSVTTAREAQRNGSRAGAMAGAVLWVCPCWGGHTRGRSARSLGRWRQECLDKEGPEGQLEGSDGTMGVGEGGLEMSEDMSRG
jgi:hypothetical protein